LLESSEKKRVKADAVPKTGAIKTGTHLGQSTQNKNIFLNKFVCNSTKNQQDNGKTKFEFGKEEKDENDQTPKMD
jgi:hypothetical protein